MCRDTPHTHIAQYATVYTDNSTSLIMPEIEGKLLVFEITTTVSATQTKHGQVKIRQTLQLHGLFLT